MTAALVAMIVLVGVVAAVALWRARQLALQLASERASREADAGERESLVRAQAIAGERERIYNDLHDDLGASLLHLVYDAASPRHADAARAVLQDLRDVVTRSRGTPGTLADVLGDIRSEATQRLAAVGIALLWEEADALPDPLLDTDAALHLHRIVREAISNVIRHAQARQLRIRIRAGGDRLGIELTDDGSGPGLADRAGSGMRNMRERADELAGDIAWQTGTQGGTKVLLELPLPPARPS